MKIGVKKRKLNTMRYCLDCSPFGSHNTRPILDTNDKCKICNKSLGSYRRRRCGSCNTKIRRHRNKLAAIRLLGGQCIDCGFNGHPVAFQFHHVQKKSFTIGAVGNKSWHVIKEELKKCILLCSNCHDIRHSSRDNEIFIQEALNYNGPNEELRMLG